MGIIIKDKITYSSTPTIDNALSTTSENAVQNKVVTAALNNKQDASTAIKHTSSTAVGSATKGVYIASDGTATTMTYELNKTVPSDAVFTDTTYESKEAVSDGTDISLVTTGDKYNWNNKTSNTGTVTNISTGVGLVGGDITNTGTIKADLKSETKSTLTATAMGSTADRQYAVGLDKDGKLSVNVPWKNINTTYTLSQDSEDGHKITLTSSDGSQKTITIPDNDTTYTLNSLGIGNVKNFDQSKAIKSITRNGLTYTYTCLDGTTGTFTQQDENDNTTYTLTQDANDGHKITFAGSDGSSKTITIPDNNTTYTLSSLGIGNVKNYDQSKAIKTITRNGLTFTYTCLDGTTGTFDQKDDNTHYTSKTITGKTATDIADDAATNGNVYLNHIENGAVVSSHNIIGAGTTSVTTDANGVITISSADSKNGTVTSVATGVGLTGGTITGSGTIKAKLKSETALANDSAAGTETAGKIYPVAQDKSGYLAVNVPWQNTWTANSSSAAGYVASGSGQANKVWKTDANGNPAWRDDANTWTAMVGATSSADGSAGYVPAPSKTNYDTAYLRADGTWSIPDTSNRMNIDGSNAAYEVNLDSNIILGTKNDGWNYGYKSLSQGNSLALGSYSTAENSSQAYGDYSHSEGYSSVANNNYAHAEGYMTQADGEGSHAIGWCSAARGNYSFAGGKIGETYRNYSFAFGNQVDKKFANTILENDNDNRNLNTPTYMFGLDASNETFSENTYFTDRVVGTNGLSGSIINDNITVATNLQAYGVYMLICVAHNALDGAFYGASTHLIVGGATENNPPTVMVIKETTNNPCEIRAGGNTFTDGITPQSGDNVISIYNPTNSSNYIQFNLIRLS